MAAPNLIGATIINGKTVASNLTTTGATTIVSNPASSGKCLKINVLNVANYNAAAVNVSIGFYSAASLGGSLFPIVGFVDVPAKSTLNVIDKTSQYYLEENTSIGAFAGSANSICITCSYEDIS
jgi:hypothetical protein